MYPIVLFFLLLFLFFGVFFCILIWCYVWQLLECHIICATVVIENKKEGRLHIDQTYWAVVLHAGCLDSDKLDADCFFLPVREDLWWEPPCSSW